MARDINVGLLFILGVSSLGLFGIVLGGWASNSHYSIIGAIRSTAQLVSYETAAGLAVISGLFCSPAHCGFMELWTLSRTLASGSFFSRRWRSLFM